MTSLIEIPTNDERVVVIPLQFRSVPLRDGSVDRRLSLGVSSESGFVGMSLKLSLAEAVKMRQQLDEAIVAERRRLPIQ